MNRLLAWVCAALAALFLAGCTYQRPEADLSWDYTPLQRDSVEFSITHHYSENYNFLVTGDSMRLLPASPADLIASLADTVWVYPGDRVVVADILRMPSGTADSVWVKVARDQLTIGWTTEAELLRNVVPEDPISHFIHLFGNRRVVVLCCVAVIAIAFALMRVVRRKKARVVHFNDIDSIYPTLLCVDVALIAVVYASVQHFVPQTWQEFYFHPTLNPFAVPPVMALLITAFWAMVILALAAIDDAGHKMGWSGSAAYLLYLLGMVMVVYLVFAATTIVYIGYVLFVAYVVFAFVRYARRRMYRYVCGKCGHGLRHKGTCPFCGARNV